MYRKDLNGKGAALRVCRGCFWGLLIGWNAVAGWARDEALRNLEIGIRLRKLKSAEAPFLKQDYIVFTYRGDGNARNVGLAVSTEDFRKVHMMDKNVHNVFIYVMPVQDIEFLDYRFLVDGLWTYDPENPDFYFDKRNIKLSRYWIPRDLIIKSLRKNPVRNEKGYEFSVSLAPGQSVSLVGSFNNWDPLQAPLEEGEAGIYSIQFRSFPPGEYYYYFLVSGKKMLDPNNPGKKFNQQGEAVSNFVVD